MKILKLLEVIKNDFILPMVSAKTMKEERVD